MANEFPNKDQTFKKGETGNPNGRPKKSFSTINEILKTEGYEPLTKSQLIEAYGLVFNADETRLTELEQDETLPYSFRLIIRELKDPKNSAKALQDYRDYLFGKANTNVDILSNGNEINQVVVYQIPDNGRD
jgi:hypothetical protein